MIWSILLVLLLIVVFASGIIIDPTPISLSDVRIALAHNIFGAEAPASASSTNAVIWDIRIPRLILGAAVGAGLAVAGAILQAVVRNALADPYILGINSGASTGAALAILFGVSAGFGEYALQGAAFIGALAASAVMFFIARSAGRLTSVRLLMAGIAVGYALSALTSFLIFASDSAEGSRSVMFWLLGPLGLGAVGGLLLLGSAPLVLAVTIVFWSMGRRIDALTVGDDAALALGVNPDRMRVILVVLTCILVGSVVAMAGLIGFVGLVIPHAARRLVGGSHRQMIPVAALLGASLLIAADIGARTLLAPQEIPIGILTSLVGAPFLILLVRRMGVLK
ncbi:iron ABC transporter permease [Corynebacterium pseudodiphtheriticum]|uniref:FecCD family ABC transporter permease n=1 Tax=Corynebacterium pseudodiphtheriticum TaxID=37637 RepID=UPI00254B04DC|nr:iron ABC transporter permease [Corynebacterium pseudodiphtheriticum]MDK8708198.1 iron ABC transporter permease [Corynebacterium pseudodiphtheriticum]